MGNHFEFTVVSPDAAWANARIDEAVAEVKRIESLLTTFDTLSQTYQINASAGITPVKVDSEVFNLIARSLRISALTQGAFDITYGSIDKRLWNFDQTMTALPDETTARKMVRLINYKNVELDERNTTVFLKHKGMRIGFGGIGKGYAADRAKRVLREGGVTSGVVNAAGDLTVWGAQPDGKSWTIGIADPDRRQFPFASLQLDNISVATSGNYEKFVMIKGEKYSHTIDPKTGYPVRGMKSVTIISSSAELADAMAIPVMVMGTKAGLHLVNQIKDLGCIIVDDHNVIHTSRNINMKSLESVSNP